jgi:hypothetical protein
MLKRKFAKNKDRCYLGNDKSVNVEHDSNLKIAPSYSKYGGVYHI